MQSQDGRLVEEKAKAVLGRVATDELSLGDFSDLFPLADAVLAARWKHTQMHRGTVLYQRATSKTR